MMTADAYFEVGTAHSTCEDYALAGATDTLSYAIVCDGCSSSKHSDVGARLQAHVAKDLILYFDKKKMFGSTVFVSQFIDTFKIMAVKKLMEIKSTMGFTAEYFDATLLMTICTPSFIIQAGWGDGFFVLQNETEKFITKISFLSGAPYYLSYELSDNKAERYRTESGSDPAIIETFKITKNDELIPCGTNEQDPMSYSFFKVRDIGGSEKFYDTLVVCSDGLNTYSGAPLNINSSSNSACSPFILGHVTAYKDFVGEFVTRRMWAFGKYCRKNEITHKDDMSCAAIHIAS